jgi:hypothetical protein
MVESIRIDFNLIERLPAEIAELKCLKLLSVVGNRISRLEKWITLVTAEIRIEWQLYCNRTTNFGTISIVAFNQAISD